MKIFEYSTKDIEEILNKPDLNKRHSNLDNLISYEWNQAMKNGLFAFNIDNEIPTKYLNGKYSFVVQKNSKRLSQKRPTQIIPSYSLSPVFDQNKFNFTKINKNEILFKFLNKDKTEDNYVLINNSPIDCGHVLLCPSLYSGLNQVLIKQAIEASLEILLLSNKTNFLLGFNSINAYASVNHLHLHAYYLNETTEFKLKHKYAFPIQNLKHADKLTENGLWFLGQDKYFHEAFCLQLFDFENNLKIFSSNVFKLVNYFNQNDIAHNLILVKSDLFSDNNDSNLVTIRCVIWPKKHSFECKLGEKDIAFAICELAGHFILPNDSDYEDINEDYLININNDFKLDKSKLAKIKNDLINLFNI